MIISMDNWSGSTSQPIPVHSQVCVDSHNPSSLMHEQSDQSMASFGSSGTSHFARGNSPVPRSSDTTSTSVAASAPVAPYL